MSSPHARPAGSPSGGADPTVLVVSDDREYASTLAGWLAEDYRVETTTGDGARGAIDSRIALVLVDAGSVDVTPADLVSSCRRRARSARVGVVVDGSWARDGSAVRVDAVIDRSATSEAVRRTVDLLYKRSAYARYSRELLDLSRRRADLLARVDANASVPPDEYGSLTARIGRLRARMDDLVGDLFEAGEGDALFRDLPTA